MQVFHNLSSVFHALLTPKMKLDEMGKKPE